MYQLVILVGNIGQDVKLEKTGSGTSFVSTSLATNESYKKGEEWVQETEWHRIVLWRAQAERFAEKAKKGTLVYLRGKNKTRKYTDRNGVERQTTEVVVAEWRVLAGKDSKGGSGYDDPPPPDEPGYERAPVSSKIGHSEENQALDDDLPF